MEFRIEYTGCSEQRILTYDDKEFSFDMEPLVSEIDFDVVINTLSLAVVDDKIVQLWGFLGLNKKMIVSDIIIPTNKKGVLRVLDKLKPGFAYSISKEEYPVYVNVLSGWVCIGNPHQQGNAVEFIDDCIAVIGDNKEFISLWLKPKKLPVF